MRHITLEILRLLYIVIFLLGCLRLNAQDRPDLDILLSNYVYPFDVKQFSFESQGHDLQMAYMDVRPKKPNGEVVLLMHGKNFNGAYWEETAGILTKQGYRVIIPDQIGFGKSSKPIGFQFSFQELAQHTNALLEELKRCKN